MKRLLATIATATLLLPIQPPESRAQVAGNKVASHRNTAPDDFAQARGLLRQGSLEEALAAVQRGLGASPNSVEGLNLLGMVYDQQGRHAGSESAFRKALKVDPHSVATLNNLAISYAAQRKLALAEQTFRATLRLQPLNRTANYNLGVVLLALHEPKAALVPLQRVRPRDTTTLLSLTDAYLLAGMTAQGLRTAQAMSTRADKDVKLHVSLAVTLASNRQYHAAISEFELANAIQPRTVDILHDLGQAYLRIRQPARAQEVLEQAIQLQPAGAETLYLLAQSQADQGKDVDALETLVRARALAPHNTDILLLLARLSMKQLFFEDAIQLLDEAKKIEPTRPDVRAALGESYFTVGKVPNALEEFKALLQLDPSAQSYAFMGLCYRHLGKFDEAKQYLNQGLKADARHPGILFNLGFIAKRQQDYAQAEQFLGQAARLDPNYADALLELGTLKMERKKYEEAIPPLRRCTQLSASPAEAYYKLAIAERSLHQTEASLRDMKIFQTLSKDPQPGPYPLQNFFEYLNRRETLSPQQRATVDVNELEAEVKQYPDRPRSIYLLAETYLKLNRSKEALQTIERLDALSGGDLRTLLGEGVLLARFHLYAEAIQRFRAALAASPTSDEARFDLANAYYQTRDYAEALRWLEQVSAEGRKEDAWLALMGDTQTRLGHPREAIEAFRQAVALNPENDQYYVSLALAQMKAGNLDQANASLQQGLDRVPDSGALYWGLGVLSVVHADDRHAETYLKKAVELMPSRQSAYATLGVFYYESGRIPEARQMLERYSERFPQAAANVTRIRQTLDARQSQPTAAGKELDHRLTAEGRREFYQLALALAEAER